LSPCTWYFSCLDVLLLFLTYNMKVCVCQDRLRDATIPTNLIRSVGQNSKSLFLIHLAMSVVGSSQSLNVNRTTTFLNVVSCCLTGKERDSAGSHNSKKMLGSKRHVTLAHAQWSAIGLRHKGTSSIILPGTHKKWKGSVLFCEQL
jgi:hypothetical protein